MSPETRSNTSRDREGAEPGEPGVLSPMGGRGWSELRERSRGTGTRRLWGVRVSAKGSQMGSGPCKTGICVKRLIASCRLPVSPVSRGGNSRCSSTCSNAASVRYRSCVLLRRRRYRPRAAATVTAAHNPPPSIVTGSCPSAAIAIAVTPITADAVTIRIRHHKWPRCSGPLVARGGIRFEISALARFASAIFTAMATRFIGPTKPPPWVVPSASPTTTASIPASWSTCRARCASCELCAS